MLDKWQSYIELIKHEVVPALGCTEPIALALAAATAEKYLGNMQPDLIEAWVSPNLMKNGIGVGVPGTGMKGMPVAAAVGALGGNPDAGLEVLKDLTEEKVAAAKILLSENKVKVTTRQVPNILYVECRISSGKDMVTVVIEDEHTNITRIVKNKETIFSSKSNNLRVAERHKELHLLAKNTRVEDIWDFAMQAPLEMIEFIEEASLMNTRISQEGLNNDYGLKVGRTLCANIKKGILQEDLMNAVIEKSSAASDARMDGCKLPVMSNSGSGNQGITATMPVVVTAEFVKASREKLIRALILSHFVAIHIKAHLDKLSALCAATAAAMGASAGIVYLMGGTEQQSEYAIANMVGDIAGIICDGAKESCSLKVSSSVGAAVRAALLALENIRVTREQGINDEYIEKVINNLGILATEGMKETDKTILNIMIS